MVCVQCCGQMQSLIIFRCDKELTRIEYGCKNVRNQLNGCRRIGANSMETIKTKSQHNVNETRYFFFFFLFSLIRTSGKVAKSTFCSLWTNNLSELHEINIMAVALQRFQSINNMFGEADIIATRK